MPKFDEKTSSSDQAHVDPSSSSSSAADVGKRPLVSSEPVAPPQAQAQAQGSGSGGGKAPAEAPKRVKIQQGLIHGEHDVATNSIDLHVDAKGGGDGLSPVDMLAVAKHCHFLLIEREQDGGPQGTFMLRPQGAAITKIVVEMLGEALGGAWGRMKANGAKFARRQGLSSGRGEARDDNKLHSSVQPEHFAYLDSLKGTNGLKMQPITMGPHGPKSEEEFSANMLDNNALGRQRMQAYKDQLNDPDMPMGPSMMITLTSAQLPRVIDIIKTQVK
ncbi:MAG TPA: hypothetical protein VFP84_15880 [Kofleriaceae bacterium]|nr:hypothetical protein [Kofleriaceae bacterium]